MPDPRDSLFRQDEVHLRKKEKREGRKEKEREKEIRKENITRNLSLKLQLNFIMLINQGSVCDECVVAVQKVLLVSKIHLLRLEYCLESHHLY